MGSKLQKSAISIIASLACATPAFAQADAVQLLLDSVGLNLTNPDAVKIHDKDFRSNDPSIKARIYKLSNGIKIKLVGKSFSKSSDIDKIRIVYNDDQHSFEKTQALLTQNYGTPANKRPQLNVWRIDNPTRDVRQATQIKIIAIDKDNERWVISADRQKGGIGNNTRVKRKTTNAGKQAQPRIAANQQYERD